MYSPLKLYYLQQLGIRPWVRREVPVTCPKIIVIVPSCLTEKAQQLLGHILSYLPKENTQLLTKERFLNSNKALLTKAVLSFETDLTAPFNQTCPVFQDDLDLLLAQPILKKELFKTLHLLMELLLK